MSDGAFCHYCQRATCLCWATPYPRLKKLVEALYWSSPGEWGVYGGSDAMETSPYVGTVDNTEPLGKLIPARIIELLKPYHPRWKENRDFIIAARNDMPWLLDLLKVITEASICPNNRAPDCKCAFCFVIRELRVE